jgi:hypothetical protein
MRVILCFKRPNLNARFPRGVAKKLSLSYVTFYPLEDIFAKTKASIKSFTELDIIKMFNSFRLIYQLLKHIIFVTLS